jgi:transcriptional repressor NrdR
VVDSRTSREARAVRRRRECLQCTRRFTTYEYVEERPLHVVKRDGALEPYDRRKLLRSIEVATAKRPIGGEIDALIEEIEHALDRSDESRISSQTLGEMVMERLKGRDHIAYVRFASVYRNFQDLTEFYEELQELDARSAHSELLRYQRELPLDPNAESPQPAAPEMPLEPDAEPVVEKRRAAVGAADPARATEQS